MSEYFIDRVQELEELLTFVHSAIYEEAPYVGIKGVIGFPGYGKTALLKAFHERAKKLPNVVAVFIDNYSPKLLEEILSTLETKGKVLYKLKKFVRSIIGSRQVVSMILDAIGEFVSPIPLKPIEALVENVVKSPELISELREKYAVALRIVESIDPKSVFVVIADDLNNIHPSNFLEIFFLLPLAIIEKGKKICIVTAIRSSHMDEFQRLRRDYYNRLKLISRMLNLKPPAMHVVEFEDPLLLRELSQKDCVELIHKVTKAEGIELSEADARKVCEYSKGHPLITLFMVKRPQLIRTELKYMKPYVVSKYLTDKVILKYILDDVYEILNELSKEGKKDELLLLYILATLGGDVNTSTMQRILNLLRPGSYATILIDERLLQLISIADDTIQFIHPIVHSATLSYFFKHRRMLIPKKILTKVFSYIKQHHVENAIVFALLHKTSLGSRWLKLLLDEISKSESLMHILSTLENVYYMYENLANAGILSIGPDYCRLVYEYSRYKLAHGMYRELLDVLKTSIGRCRKYPELHTLLYSNYAYATALYGDFEGSIRYSDRVIEGISILGAEKLGDELVRAYVRACFSKALSLHALGRFKDAALWYRKAAEILMKRGIPMNEVQAPQLGTSLLIPSSEAYEKVVNDNDLLWLCARIHLQVAHLLSHVDRGKTLRIENELYNILDSLQQRYPRNMVLKELFLSTTHRLAGSLEVMGYKDKAYELESKAAELSFRIGIIPLHGLAALGKATMLMDRGKYEDALKVLESACEALKATEYLGEYTKCLLRKAHILHLLRRDEESCKILLSEELHKLLTMTKYSSAYELYNKLRDEVINKVCRRLSTST